MCCIRCCLGGSALKMGEGEMTCDVTRHRVAETPGHGDW